MFHGQFSNLTFIILPTSESPSNWDASDLLTPWPFGCARARWSPAPVDLGQTESRAMPCDGRLRSLIGVPTKAVFSNLSHIMRYLEPQRLIGQVIGQEFPPNAIYAEHSARFCKECLSCSLEGHKRRGTITCKRQSQNLNEQAFEKTNACHLTLIPSLKYLKLMSLTPSQKAIQLSPNYGL